MSNESSWHICPVVVGRIEGDRLMVDCPSCGEEHAYGRGTGHILSTCSGTRHEAYLVVDAEDVRIFEFTRPVYGLHSGQGGKPMVQQ
ncbi:hypothetical protein [Streptomyces erythrochromogenes]|uniref:hypothetical protein n=1 Tax=Streptomyces erythrochromogenes TaxID=285574 RepID=UPI00382DFCD1